MKLNCNCCDGIYNSFDVHFTSACDNKCKHCIDLKFDGLGINKPNVKAIANSIIGNQKGYDDVLFLGGEPCLYLEELLECVKLIKEHTDLEVFVTTAVPKVCYTKRELFIELLSIIDGMNLSVQHYKEDVACNIRNVASSYDRQTFYNSLPFKNKIRINLNIVKPFLYTKEDITACLKHYDKMGFNSIKLSEIQHGKDYYVSFEETFNLKFGAPYAKGCQTYIDFSKIVEGFKTPLLLKRSCFLCEETLNASFTDGVKVLCKIFKPSKNNYAVIYEDGSISRGWR